MAEAVLGRVDVVRGDGDVILLGGVFTVLFAADGAHLEEFIVVSSAGVRCVCPGGGVLVFSVGG